MNDHWFVFCTFGEMSVQDILSECQQQGWVPVLIVRKQDKVVVPCFGMQETAIKFARRNLDKKQVFGTTVFTDEDVKKLEKEWIKDKGWILEKMDHPRLMKDIGKIDVEVFEYAEKPDVYGVWGTRCQHAKKIAQA